MRFDICVPDVFQPRDEFGRKRVNTSFFLRRLFAHTIPQKLDCAKATQLKMNQDKYNGRGNATKNPSKRAHQSKDRQSLTGMGTDEPPKSDRKPTPKASQVEIQTEVLRANKLHGQAKKSYVRDLTNCLSSDEDFGEEGEPNGVDKIPGEVREGKNVMLESNIAVGADGIPKLEVTVHDGNNRTVNYSAKFESKRKFKAGTKKASKKAKKTL